MTPTEQIAWLREAAHLRALQRMPTSIRDQTKRAAFVAYAHREELAKRQPQIDWLERKAAANGGRAMSVPRFIAMTSSAKSRGKWGPYRNVALVETDGIELPRMISRHAKHLVRIVQHYGSHYEGNTERCAYRQTLAHAEARAAQLNQEAE